MNSSISPNRSFLIIVLLFICVSTYSCASNDRSKAVTINTNKGSFTIMLFNETPMHRDNFIKMSKTGFYDDILFHRVINNFVIQAGDPDSKSHEKEAVYGEGTAKHNVSPEFRKELYHIRGAVGAAREGDSVNPEKLSSGSHFYIVLGGREITPETIKKTETSLTHEIPSAIKEKYMQEGGEPRLDGQYTVFGFIINGMDIVDSIAKEETDYNDRPIGNIIIESCKITKLSKEDTQKYYKQYNE